MSLRLKKLDDVKIFQYDADVWQQGNMITVALPLEQIDKMYSNTVFKQYDPYTSNVTLSEAIKSMEDEVKKVKSCAHVFEAAIVNGRKTNKCKHCIAEIK